MLPVHFFLSALAVGLAMVIFESGMSARAFGRALEFQLLRDLGKAMGVCLAVVFCLRFWDLVSRGALRSAFIFQGLGSREAGLFWLETGLLATPMVLVFLPQVRGNPQALFASSIVAVAGFLTNRLNVSITGLEGTVGGWYFPSWMEVAVTMSIVALGFVLFSLAVQRLPIFPPERPHVANLA